MFFVWCLYGLSQWVTMSSYLSSFRVFIQFILMRVNYQSIINGEIQNRPSQLLFTEIRLLKLDEIEFFLHAKKRYLCRSTSFRRCGSKRRKCIRITGDHKSHIPKEFVQYQAIRNTASNRHSTHFIAFSDMNSSY